MNNLIRITDIQRFCTQDGPGIRTVVFFKGCPLRCEWCHNPETQNARDEIFYNGDFCISCGKCAVVCPFGAHFLNADGLHSFDRGRCVACGKCADVCPAAAQERASSLKSVEEIMQIVKRDAVFYGKRGGLTLSGGEPLFQKEGATALLSAAKKSGISAVIETCGYFDGDILNDIAGKTDLLLWDIKDTDGDRHLRYTGAENNLISENLKKADALGMRTRLRCIVVASVNDDETHFGKVADIYASLRHCEGVELLPYHELGVKKRALLGESFCSRTEWVPTDAKIKNIKKLLRRRGVKVF